MPLSARQKQVLVEALMRSAADSGIDERQHRLLLAQLLLRPAADQKAEAIRALADLKAKYEDTLAGLDAGVAQQRTQLTDAVAEIDGILTELSG